MQDLKNKIKIFEKFTIQSPKHQKPKKIWTHNKPVPNEWIGYYTEGHPFQHKCYYSFNYQWQGPMGNCLLRKQHRKLQKRQEHSRRPVHFECSQNWCTDVSGSFRETYAVSFKISKCGNCIIHGILKLF